LARALIVGCGCRGRLLGETLQTDGWQVRGTSRTPAGCDAIAAAGIDAAPADPDRAGTVLDLVDDVAVVVWALGSATGPAEQVAAVNVPRLERVLERLVDTPVRGFVYEGAGSAPAEVLAAGSELVRGAGRRWRMPVAVVATPPEDHSGWANDMAAAVRGLLGLGPMG
jgi:nucleoside-diphosphate-sugar epimerase